MTFNITINKKRQRFVALSNIYDPTGIPEHSMRSHKSYWTKSEIKIHNKQNHWLNLLHMDWYFSTTVVLQILFD